jgi:lysophospholipase L1-like esterase
VLLVGLVASCGRDTPALSPLAADARVLAFGDSLTKGTGASADASYPAVLSRRLDREVINAGVAGETSGEGRERLSGVLARTQPDLLLLCHGGNDFLQDYEPARIRRNLRGMIEQARDRGVEVVLIGVPSRGIMLSTASLYEDLAGELDVPLVAGVIGEILGDPTLRSDRVHPNRQGYRMLAGAVYDVLVASGAVNRP